MSSDVVLTAALRNNLLSLQNTQSLIDTTQLRLATGLKVNSALDNPSNFFAAQSLDNRANDLNRLLDGISQSIRTIEEADNGVTALTSLIEQAQSIASSARDELASSEGNARIVGNVDLSTTADITGGAIANGDIIRIVTTDDSGAQIIEDITITTGDTGASLAANITNAFADNRNGEVQASLTENGFLQIDSDGGRSFKITAAAAGTDILAAGYAELGFANNFAAEVRGAATLTSTTVVAGNTATSLSLFESAGNLAEAGDLLTGTYIDSDGSTIFTGLAVGDTITFNIDESGTVATSGAFTLTATSTFQDLVDAVNQTAAVSDLISADFDSSTGTFAITSLSDTVSNVELTYTAAGVSTFDIGLGDPSGNLDPAASAAAAGTYDTVLSFNSSTEALDDLATDYNTVRAQVDDLVADAQYRGVNLLNSDNLTTFFNEDNTSTLTTNGVNFTANGLGLTEATFRSSTAIELSATQSRDALIAVRSFGSTLANNLAIIQTREDFTKATINTLKAGADDLTVADQNEEGANLLALQTRQTLGVTSLSLASQSQQAVLRLF